MIKEQKLISLETLKEMSTEECQTIYNDIRKEVRGLKDSFENYTKLKAVDFTSEVVKEVEKLEERIRFLEEFYKVIVFRDELFSGNKKIVVKNIAVFLYDNRVELQKLRAALLFVR